MSTKPVRTYLDPDAVGPLPRATVADDSDALSAARTILRVPNNTQEIRPSDVLEVFDPNRRPESLAPTTYDTAGYSVPRTNLTRYVVGALAVSGVILVAAAARTFFGGQPSVAEQAPRSVTAAPAAAPQAPEKRPTSAPAIPPPPPSSPAITTGTLRLDPALQGQRVMVDGVLLSVPAALIQCGPHEVAVGASARAREIEVPCGGEVTVYR
jgi:hypothetical protein